MAEAGAVAEEAHDRKLLKSLGVCQREGIQFVPLAWESTGSATQTVHEQSGSGLRWKVLVVGTLRI